MADNKFEVIIGANSAELNSELSKATKSLSNFQSKVDSIASQGRKLATIGAGLTAAVTAPLTLMAKNAVELWDVQAKAIAQVEAGIKSTGMAAGFTSRQLQDMASALQNNSLFGDEDILKNVTSQLLSFTNVAGEQFEKAQLAALDLATRMGGDLKGAALQLGKALNDPILGVSALARSGVQFSESQKQVIESLVETGKTAEAQTIILKELEKQFGGSAEAAAKAGLGPLKQIQNAWGDVLEEFGKIISEFLVPVVDHIKTVVDWFTNLSDTTKKIIVVVGGLVAAVGPLLLGLGGLMSALPIIVTGVGALGAAFTFLLSPIGLVTAALVGVVVAVVRHWDKIRPYIVKAQNWFIDLYNESVILRVGINYIANNFKSVFAIVNRILGLAWNQFKNFGKLVIDLFGNIGDVISGALTLDPKKIIEGVKGFGESFKASFDRTSTNIIGAVKGLANDIGDIWSKDLTAGKLERKALLSIKLPDLAKDVENEVSTKTIEGVKNGISKAQEEIDKSPEAFSLQIPIQLLFDGDQLYKNTRRLFEANEELSERMQATFEQMSVPIKKGLSDAQVALIEFENIINERFQEISKDSITGGLQGIFSSIGTAIGEGGNVLQAAGGALIGAFSGFLSEMGGMLVKYGTLAVLKGKLDLAIKAGGLTSIGAGIAAIAVGALLSVAGAALGSRASQGLSGGASGGYTGYSGYSSPTSNVNSVNGANQNNEVTFTIRGNDLVGAINNNQERTSRITGL